MKKLFFVITIIMISASVSSVFGQTAKEVKILSAKQTVDKASKFTFKLIDVEDSRCPPDANCVWAGNAKVKFTIAKGKSAEKTFELNSAVDPKSITFEGYEIAFKDLSPTPKSTDTKPIKYLVKLTVTKKPKSM